MATSSISVQFIQRIASSPLKTYGLDRYKMPFKRHTRNTVMQVNTEKDNARGSEYSPKLLVINPQKIITNLNNYIKEFTLWAQPELPLHFFTMDEILRELCLNRVSNPHPELLQQSTLFGGFFECKCSFTNKPMVITEPAVPSSQLLGYYASFSAC